VICSAPYARNMAGRTNHTTLVTVASSIPMVLLPKAMGAQEAQEETDLQTSTFHIRENVKGQILLR
jgi:hypothetical protein